MLGWLCVVAQPRSVGRGCGRLSTLYVAAVLTAAIMQWLATGSDDKTVRIWEVATGRQYAVVETGVRAVPLYLAWRLVVWVRNAFIV